SICDAANLYANAVLASAEWSVVNLRDVIVAYGCRPAHVHANAVLYAVAWPAARPRDSEAAYGDILRACDTDDGFRRNHHRRGFDYSRQWFFRAQRDSVFPRGNRDLL